jgi:hypothetical protein
MIESSTDRIASLESKVDELKRHVEILSREVERVSLLHEPLVPSEIDRFTSLVAEWKDGRGHLSKIRDLSSHPAYQQIIGMGPKVIPLLLREMEQRPSHWDWALRSITGADPVPKQSMGKIKEMAAIWAQWGRDHGYEW